MGIYLYNSKLVYLSSDFVYRIKAYSRGKKTGMNFPIEENKKNGHFSALTNRFNI